MPAVAEKVIHSAEANSQIMKTEAVQLYDVVAVNIDTHKVTALFGERKTLPNAEAIVSMAVMRRGVDEEFYAEVATGKFKVGDTYA